MDKLKRWFQQNRKPISFAIVACIAIAFYFILSSCTPVTQWIANLWSILTPFVYGAVIAYLLRPICNTCVHVLCKIKFMRKHPQLTNTISIVTSIICALGTITLLGFAIIPGVINSVSHMISNMPQILDDVASNVEGMLEHHEYLRTAFENMYDKVEPSIESALAEYAEQLPNILATGATNLIGFFFDFIIGFIAAVYMLGHKTKVKNGLNNLLNRIPNKAVVRTIQEEVRFADKAFSGFFTGTIIDAIIVGVTTYLFGVIYGLPEPLLIGVILAITNVIPIFGPFIGAVPSAFIVLAYTPEKVIWFLVYMLIMQQIDGHILAPKVLGSAVGMSGLATLFAIVVGGGLFGPVGMIVGVPMMSVFIDIFNKFIAWYDERHPDCKLNPSDEDTHPN